jgi:hypothetical protein
MSTPKNYRNLFLTTACSASFIGTVTSPQLNWLWITMALLSIGVAILEALYPYYLIRLNRKQGMIVKTFKTQRTEIEFAQQPQVKNQKKIAKPKTKRGLLKRSA